MPNPVHVADALDRLDVSVDPCTACQRQLSETSVANHDDTHPSPRRVVHALAGTMGADWDEAEAVEFLRQADRIVETEGYPKATGHGIAALFEGRWRAFSTKATS